MKKLPVFEDFVPMGFGNTNAASFSLGGINNTETGYNMDAIVGPVQTLGNHVAEQANMYESNDHKNHTAESYLKEAKHHINESIDKAYETYSTMDEAAPRIKTSKEEESLLDLRDQVRNAQKGGSESRYAKDFEKAKKKALSAIGDMITYIKIGV